MAPWADDLMEPFVGDATADLERRFGGLGRLYGAARAEKIRHSHVVIVGIGGVGSWAAEAVARSGVARITLVDLDHIAESNINRQIHALETSLGQAKVRAMQERIALINPSCLVRCVEEFATPENWPRLLSLDAESDKSQLCVIDACDQVKTKTAMAAWALCAKVPLISVGAAGGKRQAHRVDIDDLSLVTHDPLLASVRYRLRKANGASKTGRIGVACVFSREPVQRASSASVACALTMASEATVESASQTDESLNCHGYGSVVSVTATFGMCAAGWALDKISS